MHVWGSSCSTEHWLKRQQTSTEEGSKENKLSGIGRDKGQYNNSAFTSCIITVWGILGWGVVMVVVIKWEGERLLRWERVVKERKGGLWTGELDLLETFGEVWSSWSQQSPNKMSFIFFQVFSWAKRPDWRRWSSSYLETELSFQGQTLVVPPTSVCPWKVISGIQLGHPPGTSQLIPVVTFTHTFNNSP